MTNLKFAPYRCELLSKMTGQMLSTFAPISIYKKNK